MLLSALIVLPLVFCCLLPVARTNLQVKVASVCFAGFYFLFSLLVFVFFDSDTQQLQMVTRVPWIRDLGIDYFVGVDGLNLWFVFLTAFLCPVSVVASWSLIQKHIKGFYICLFAMTAQVMGCFLAWDAVLFYVFFESSLIPLYFLIGLWGGREKIKAAFQFFIYTALGSLFLLAGIVALMVLVKESTGQLSASLLDFYRLELFFMKGSLLSTQNILFLCFFVAFAIKLPLVPFHTWLPLAHVQAPAPASAWLAALVLKMGGYGFFRFVLPLFPDSMEMFAPFMILTAGLGVVYGAFMALAQTDIKKVVAYSSVSHMSYILLGLFAFHLYALTGAFYQMITHAVSSAGLFLLVGMIAERTRTLDVKNYGGLARTMPRLAVFFIIISLSVMAFPSTGGFVSEFLILAGVFKHSGPYGVMFALWGVVLGAAYMLYLIHRVFFGPTSLTSKQASPLSLKETCLMIPFVVLIFVSGLLPGWVLSWSSASLSHLNQNRKTYHLEVWDVHSKKTSKSGSFFGPGEKPPGF